MTAYATQDMVADALIYGADHRLTEKPPQVRINADDTVTLDPGTRVTRAPRRMVGGCCVGRKWPAREDAGQRVIAEDGDWVEVAAPANASLFGMMAESNCAYANALGRAQLLAVWWCVMNRHFPLGDGQWLYQKTLAAIEADALKRATAALTGAAAHTALGDDVWVAADQMSTGEIRRTLVNKAGSGCNAPTDSYLRLAAQLQRGDPVIGY